MDPSSETATLPSKPLPRSPTLNLASMVALGLCAIYLLQCAWFIRTQSLTYDEPVDIAAGLDAWHHNRFELWNDHTPLARLLCTLPLLERKWQIDIETSSKTGWRATRIAPDPEAMARRARSMNVILGLVLAWLLWTTARRMFSEGAANLVLALFVFSPAMVAVFAVATTDGAATLMIFAAAVQLTRWRNQPSLRRTLLLGLVLGLMLLAKFSTPVMFLVAIAWMLVLQRERAAIDPRRWNWGKTCTAVLITLLVVWAGYFFHVSRLTWKDGELITTFPNRQDVVYKPVRSRLNLTLPVPAGEYLEGFRTVTRHNRHGMPGFLLGRVSKAGGWKTYYPVVLLLKWPTIVLLLFATSVVLMLRRKVRVPSGLLVMASFPAVYFAFAIFARFDLGERHILPVYPFVLLFAGNLWEAAKTRRAALALLLLAVVVNAADALRYAPDYLSYFNVFVRPAESYRLLTDSNLDWGQGLLALRRYEQDHSGETISLAYIGGVDPRVYGIRARRLAEGERATGTVVVSATNLSGQFLDNPDSYRWVLQYPRTQILNHSLQVFQVPPSNPAEK